MHSQLIRNGFASIGMLAALSAPASARPSSTPTPAPTPTPVADPLVTKVARQQFVAWQAGSINKRLYAPELVPKLTDAKVNDVAHALSALGPLTDTTFVGPFSAADIPSGAVGYIYQMHCQEGSIYMWMIIDSDGKIATVFFKDKLDIETLERPASEPEPPPPSPPRSP
jgi:hypothetical protein